MVSGHVILFYLDLQSSPSFETEESPGMAAAPKDIFLSYGREPEVSAFVKKLKEDLEKGGFSVWLDNDDIAAG